MQILSSLCLLFLAFFFIDTSYCLFFFVFLLAVFVYVDYSLFIYFCLIGKLMIQMLLMDFAGSSLLLGDANLLEEGCWKEL